MRFTVTEVHKKSYRPLFAREDVGMIVVYVEVVDSDGDVHTYGLSHRDDDPESAWFLDSHLLPNGAPHYVHGEGDRSVRKSAITDDHESPMYRLYLEILDRVRICDEVGCWDSVS